jgi:uncharacterized protein with FMN-binding domain
MMKFSTGTAALVVSAATIFTAVIVSSAEAARWSVLSALTGQGSRPTSSDDAAVAANRNPTVQRVANRSHYRDGSYAGPAVDAYYGLVQVQANIQNGRLVSVDVLQYPSDRRTSRAINAQALPMLESEVISAQSARVNTVTGATLTSGAYLRSMNAALRQAGT